jgi:hypothetical protein
MNALRLNAGFAEPQFTARTGLPWSSLDVEVRGLAEQGLLEHLPRDSAAHGQPPRYWRASRRGRELLNDVVQRFLPDQNSEAAARS